MEPLTHFLTGACIGRAGFNRRTAYATLAAALAAEAADLDILWGLAGPVEELKHHRGITHTFLGAPFIAGAVVGAIWIFHFWRARRRERHARLREDGALPPLRQEAGARMGHSSAWGAGETAVPAGAGSVHWGWLYFAALVAALSHILLDWTNNYGVRPFFPFNPRWYAGSFMFIAEPVVWAIFLVAFAMPWLLGLADREIGARRRPFRGQGCAIFGLAAFAAVGLWRWAEHAEGMAMLRQSQVASELVLRVALEPYPVNPWRWHAILETKDFYQTAEVDTRSPSAAAAIVSDPVRDLTYKPTLTPAAQAAERTFLGRVYLDWASWAVVRDLGPVPVAGMASPTLPPARHWTTVEFTDLRFDYSLLAERRTPNRAPLSGWVYIADRHEDAGEVMGGREQVPPNGVF